MLSKTELNHPQFHSSLDLQLYQACCPEKGKSVDLSLIQTLLAGGANPNACFENALFPIAGMETGKRLFPLLHLIAGKPKSAEIAALLINAGADLSQTDTCIHNSPLLTAIAMHDRNLAAFYIAEINENGKAEVLATLSQKDTGIECQNTPIVLALKKGMNEIALMLIKSGADVNMLCRNDESALHWACMLRENEVVSALLEHEAFTDIRNSYGHTPFDYYQYQIRYIDVTNPFTTYPATRVLTANMREFSDLYFHVYRHSINSVIERIKRRNQILVDEIIFQVLATGGQSDISLEERHQATLAEQFEYIEKRYNSLSGCFIPDQSIIDDQKAYSEIVHECTDEIELKKTKGSFLGLAVKKCDKEKIALYLTDPSLINAQDEDGFTALHWAAMRRNADQIKLLMTYGANPEIKNKYGRTPVDYYQYEIRARDFQRVVSTKSSMDSLSRQLAPGDCCMPEFCEAYFTEPMRFIGTSIRNKKQIDLDLFAAPKVTVTQAAQSSESPLQLAEGNQPKTDLITAAESTSSMPRFFHAEDKKNSSEQASSSSHHNKPQKIKMYTHAGGQGFEFKLPYGLTIEFTKVSSDPESWVLESTDISRRTRKRKIEDKFLIDGLVTAFGKMDLNACVELLQNNHGRICRKIAKEICESIQPVLTSGEDESAFRVGNFC